MRWSVRKRARCKVGPLLLILLAGWTGSAHPLPLVAQTDDEPGRQVTLFAVLATPDSQKVDPKLARVQGQLRKLLPGYGFKLLDVQSKRLHANESIKCDLKQGLVAATTLIHPIDENGKVVVRCVLAQNEIATFDTMVATPPNQLFFCDRPLADGSRLLIGVGAR